MRGNFPPLDRRGFACEHDLRVLHIAHLSRRQGAMCTWVSVVKSV